MQGYFETMIVVSNIKILALLSFLIPAALMSGFFFIRGVFLKRLFFLVLAVISCNSVCAKESYGIVFVSSVVSVYDADTFRVDIDAWPPIVGKNVPIRVLGVDAPEIRGKCPSEKLAAKQARAFTLSSLSGATQIELRNIKRGKYFRLLAEVYIDGNSLSEMLIDAGHARYYAGGKRERWCSDL